MLKTIISLDECESEYRKFGPDYMAGAGGTRVQDNMHYKLSNEVFPNSSPPTGPTA